MNIREIKKQDVSKIISVMCDAFMSYEVYKYFIEDEAERAKFLGKFMKFRLKFGMKKGRVFVSDDCESVAIWLEPNKKMTPIDLILCGGFSAIRSCTPDQRQRILKFNSFADEQLEKAIAQPFYHLSPICVSPKFQGKGYAKKLIEAELEHIKKSGVPCYLETQSPQNIAIYEKYGFKTVGEAQIPGSDVMNFAMVFGAQA